MNRLIEKCRRYAAIGVKQILVIDPEHRFGLEWKVQGQELVMIDTLLLPNGRTLQLADLWARLDMELQ